MWAKSSGVASVVEKTTGYPESLCYAQSYYAAFKRIGGNVYGLAAMPTSDSYSAWTLLGSAAVPVVPNLTARRLSGNIYGLYFDGAGFPANAGWYCKAYVP